MSIVTEFSPSRVHERIFEISSLSITGLFNVICRQCYEVSVNRFLSSPMVARREVTNSSLIASNGGLLT